ncbi:MAG: response regulator [Desulfocapsaceae bacterium]|nr:response regulator [Desulfocapsaceae bacterium]
MRTSIFSGICNCQDNETVRKIVMLTIFLILAFSLLFFMGIIALTQKAVLLGIADFIMSAFLFALLVYLHKTGDEPTASRLGVICVLFFFCCLFSIGGVHTTAFMWLYTFPLFSLYLLGLRQGLWLTGLLYLFCTGFLVFNLYSRNVHIYSSDFTIRFIPSYLLVCILAFLVEKSRSDTRIAMLEKQQLLAGTIDKLQAKEKELEETRNQLELRVMLRTTELERANQQLRVEIEERQLAQQEQLHLEAELLRVEKMELLGRLAGGVAHDLNNVLSGVVSYPDLLLLKLSPENEMYGPLQNIRRAGTRAAAIVQDLLTLARRGIPISERVQLNDIITAHLQSPEFITLLKIHPGVTVETHLAPNLHAINGSPLHLEKAIMNLLVNSFEAMEKEGIVVVTTENRYVNTTIQGYETTVPGNYVTLVVSDTGMGIPEENLDKIFEPFFSSKIMGRSGTGLGMTVVWGTIKDHGGYLDVTSFPGAGTTITVFLPVPDEEAAPQVKPRPQTIEQGKQETILLVDDVLEQRLLGTSILTTLGYRVETASGGEEALKFLQNHSVDLVLLDMIMEPGMDGLDTYMNIIKIKPNQKVIIVSGYSETERTKTALELGVRNYIKKPYTLEGIAAVMNKELSS